MTQHAYIADTKRRMKILVAYDASAHAELLALDPLLDPPHGIVGLVDVGDGLAGSGQVVELPFLDRLLDAVLGDELDCTAAETVLTHERIIPSG